MRRLVFCRRIRIGKTLPGVRFYKNIHILRKGVESVDISEENLQNTQING